MQSDLMQLLRRQHVRFFMPLFAVVFSIVCVANTYAGQKRVFMAPDDHTDYFWSATGDEYRQHFQTMLDYYMDQADISRAVDPPDKQSRFSADGSLWLYEYEKNRTPGDFQRLIDNIKSGHISAPMNPLVITYGGVPVEAVIRSMYYSGQLERRYGAKFPLAIAMENAGMSYGLGAVWAGSGAKYSWKGVCNCPSLIPNLDERDHEIYNWRGPDGSTILMKWNSLHNAADYRSIGGYAEARVPSTALDIVTTNAAANGFVARYPYNTIGVFGQGWDDILTTNLDIQNTCKTKSDSTRNCIVSNTTDFFEEFSARYGATIPTVSAGFGNEWDLAPASLAEVSARVKRSLEKLRSAETLATLVSVKDPSFLDGRDTERDKAFLNLGLFFEHDFENGGPHVAGSVRIAWQRQVATQIENYVNTLMADAKTTLSAMIQNNGSSQRFFVFNPLSWTRSDIADIPYTGSVPVDVIDLSTMTEVPSQAVTIEGVQYLRMAAPNIPSVGYKVFEIRPDSGQLFTDAPTADASTGIMENEFYRLTVSPRGAITSFIDKRLGNREFAGSIGGLALNDLGPSSGTFRVENAGPVSVTLIATAASPLAHTTRVTLTRGSDRVAIQNEVTQNFGGTRTWKFSFNLTNPTVQHEEVGAIARAKLTTAGGSYAPRNARYDYLTLNHFADMSGAGSVGVTLSNADAYFMRVGNSSVASLDTTTPQISVVLGASLRPYNPIVDQAGDRYFLQRFALQAHGAYDRASAMRFALEHQNPLTVGAVSGGAEYPETSYSYLSISNPSVLLWSLKPAEEGIGEGVIARVWNLSPTPASFSLKLAEPIARAKQVWHVETDRADAAIAAGALNTSIAQNQLLSYRLFPASLPASVKVVASDARAMERGSDPGAFTITRTGDVSQALSVRYTVSGSATAGTDYQALAGTATIPAGSATTTVPVVPLTDAVAEPEETVILTLTAQPAYLLSQWASATVSILNDNSVSLAEQVSYPFNEGTGAITRDVLGSNPATLVGTTWVLPGKFGAAALAFNGISSKVTTGLTTHAPQRTYLLWSNRTGEGNSNYPRLFDKRTSGSEVEAFYYDSPAKVYRYLRIWSGGIGSWAIPAPSANAWRHIAVVYDASNASNNPRIYVDGVVQIVTRTNAPSGSPLTNPDPYVLGNRGTGDRSWNGQIDNVRIYKRVLTTAEVQADMITPIDSTLTQLPPDVETPLVALISPRNGTTVSGTISVNAKASDTVNVVGLQFTLNGANREAEVTSTP